jgi:hypothetical protein
MAAYVYNDVAAYIDDDMADDVSLRNFFPNWISAYINPLQPSSHTFLAQPIYISAQQMPNSFKTGI